MSRPALARQDSLNWHKLDTAMPASPMIARGQIPAGASAMRVNNCEMVYIEKGVDTAIVLVHGAMSDFRYFAETVDLLASRYRAITVSLRHYYPEPWDGNGSTYSVKQHVADIAAFIRARDLGPVHLVGHSRGGSVALYVATYHSDLVRSLVFAEGGANMPAFDASFGTAQPARQRARNALALLEQGKMEEGPLILHGRRRRRGLLETRFRVVETDVSRQCVDGKRRCKRPTRTL
jgi:pimeloyl-ACP methyl ester carboxylesterase